MRHRAHARRVPRNPRSSEARQADLDGAVDESEHITSASCKISQGFLLVSSCGFRLGIQGARPFRQLKWTCAAAAGDECPTSDRRTRGRTLIQALYVVGCKGLSEVQKTLFLSRAGADAAFADRIGRILEDTGYRVVLEQWDFANRNFISQMHDALGSGARVVALLSPEYLKSDHCAAEWQNVLANDPLNKGARLIVLRVVEYAPLGMLAGLAYWDLVPIRDNPALLTEIVSIAVQDGRRKTETPIAGAYWRVGNNAITRSDLMDRQARTTQVLFHPQAWQLRYPNKRRIAQSGESPETPRLVSVGSGRLGASRRLQKAPH